MTDYDEDLHQAWVAATMDLVRAFAESYCDHKCIEDRENLKRMSQARHALRRHLWGQPASMDLEKDLRKERDAARDLAVRWLRKFQTETLPTPEMLEETHAFIKDVRATVHGSPLEHIGEKAQQS